MSTILDQAASIVDADREKTYGKPDKNLRAKLKSQTEP